MADSFSSAQGQPPTPSAPPSYEEATMYPDVSHLIPPGSKSSPRNGSPFDPLRDASTLGHHTRAPSNQSDHWGVIGYFQPATQTYDAAVSADPYIVLTFPEDLIPKVTPQQRLNLPYLNNCRWELCAFGMPTEAVPAYFKTRCKVPMDSKFSLQFDKVNLMQRQLRVFAAAPDHVVNLQRGTLVSWTKSSYQTSFVKEIADKMANATLRIVTPWGTRFYKFQNLHHASTRCLQRQF